MTSDEDFKILLHSLLAAPDEPSQYQIYHDIEEIFLIKYGVNSFEELRQKFVNEKTIAHNPIQLEAFLKLSFYKLSRQLTLS